ncbi:MAG: MBL fold metallo-hydrolase [Bacteroidales bacterium]|nr:MBL fold metallo-hydrolase [Candidatus Equimonas faecalis]
MKITVHRGLNQIGGCITEISTETSRVFIDFGQNLPGNTATLSFEEQVKEDTLLVERILTLNKREHEAVIFTHAHEDHVGLISHLPNEMPIFMGEGTRDILLAKYDLLAHHALKQLLTKMRKEKAPSTARRKVQQQAIVAERTYFLVENAHTWTRTKPRQRPKNFSVGNIRITPFFNCHSCYDSHMFLIEADGQRIWHTGDYREHGYMGKGLFPTLRKYATNIDTLITEGTMLNREDICIHEHEVMTKMGYVMQAFKYVFVLASATDIERLASVKEAAKIAHKPLYTGSALMNRCMKIYSQREAEASKGLFEFKAHFFTDHSLATIKRKGMVLAFGTGQTERIEELAQQLPPKEVLFIYASWDGYYKDPAQITHNSKYKELHNFFPNVVDIHTSGHADRNTIHEVIKTISPRKVICIHKEEDVKL